MQEEQQMIAQLKHGTREKEGYGHDKEKAEGST